MNPFICEDGGFPIQSTVSRVEQSLTLLQRTLQVGVDHTESASLDFDECCAIECVIEGMRGALRDVVNKLDDYELKEKLS